RALADAMPQLVWTANPDGSVGYYNSRMRQPSGSERNEKGFWVWQRVIHPAHREATSAAWFAAMQSGQTYPMEHRVRMVDGPFRWFLSRAVPTRRDGKIVKWYGTATDIDDNKKVEEALRYTEAQRAAIIAHAPIGVYLVDSELRLQEINAQARRTFENIEPLIGANIGNLMHALMPKREADQITDHF